MSGAKGHLKDVQKREAYVGWTGMASASSLAHFNSSDSGDRGLETVEIDPQYAEGLGFAMGDVVRCSRSPKITLRGCEPVC